jgi:hypothetical protein
MKVNKAIDELQEFLECDLYTKFRPFEKIKGETWIRHDYFRNEKEFIEYLEQHFNILRKAVKG